MKNSSQNQNIENFCSSAPRNIVRHAPSLAMRRQIALPLATAQTSRTAHRLPRPPDAPIKHMHKQEWCTPTAHLAVPDGQAAPKQRPG